MRFIKLLTLVLAPLSSFAAVISEGKDATLHQTVIEPRISYEQYTMPNDIPSLGVLGLHALVDFNASFYGGLGLYSAVNGDSGGYFALALEGGLQHPLWKKILIDGGARVGGGGGRRTPVGGGIFVEPYLGLKYDFDWIRTGAYYSYINYLDGKIESQQVGLELTLPFTFSYVTANELNPCSYFSSLHFPSVHEVGSTQNYIAGVMRTYLPNEGVMTDHGLLMASHFEFVGFEAAHYLTDHAYLFFNFSGAFHGHQNGYADELLGLGYRLPVRGTPIDGIVKFGAGSGGGGDVSTGGGFIYAPMLGLEYHLNQHVGIEVNGGYVQAPTGDYQGKEISLLLKYYFSDAKLLPGAPDQDDEMKRADDSQFESWRIRLLNQTYLKPKSESGQINPTMQLMGTDFDYYVARYFYLTGQAAFAYVGRQTGGYFSGLIGLGVESPVFFHECLNLFGEFLGGTAGGAGLDIGQGALIEPVLGLQYHLNEALALQASVGRLIAVQGQFSSTTLNGGIAYKFWSIT